MLREYEENEGIATAPRNTGGELLKGGDSLPLKSQDLKDSTPFKGSPAGKQESHPTSST